MTDARIPLELLSALRTSSTPPTPAEIGSYVNFLIGRKLYDLAYYTWLQFLPAAELRSAGLLFNGSFAAAPSGAPFDWQITSGSGVTIDIVPKPDSNGERALLVDFQYGRVDYRSVTELVMLAPGTYEFKGKYKGELVGPRGLKWRIVCTAGATTRVGESAMIIGRTPDWRNVGFTFTVPATDCRAQYVRLDLDSRMPSEQFVSGSILFDDLQISRLANPPNLTINSRIGIHCRYHCRKRSLRIMALLGTFRQRSLATVLRGLVPAQVCGKPAQRCFQRLCIYAGLFPAAWRRHAGRFPVRYDPRVARYSGSVGDAVVADRPAVEKYRQEASR